LAASGKILVIRFSSIGDIVLTTSFIATLKKTFPNFEIHYLTLDKFSSILEFHPKIDRVIELNSNSSLKDLLELNKFIKSSNYSRIFDLHGSIRSRLITKGIRRIISRVKKPRFKRLVLFQFHINMFPSNFSATYMYHNCLEENKNIEFPATYLSVSDLEQKNAIGFLKNNNVEGRFIAIVPGAAWPQKQWGVAKYSKAITKIISRSKKSVVLLGGEKDKINYEIEKINNQVINLTGKTNLRQAMSILSLSDTVLGSDTGLVHIAEALGKSVNMILGPTAKETGGGVSLSSSKNIETDLWCRPCSQNGKNSCYRSSQHCMNLISSETAVKSVLERL
jgi:lipopolysaccharide heptosyltransferase II